MFVLRRAVYFYSGVVFRRNVSSNSTIFALSTVYGKSGVAVIRISGPRSLEALHSLLKRKDELKPRYAYLRSLYHPKTSEMIDKGLVFWFRSPASFTGEDSCELQIHGSVAVIAALQDALGQLEGLRPAFPGEFTKRAFYNNKLNLTEVEGLADLIHAETESQRKQAILQSNGALGNIYNDWRQRLIHSTAHLEAFIDFSEDEDLNENIVEELITKVEKVSREIQNHLNDRRQGEILRSGVKTVIVGAPNVGKSSFFNVLCQRPAAIVTEIAGTTRDVIESSYDIAGYPVRLADTAGLRSNTDDPVEREGIIRTKNCLKEADLILLLVDATILVKKNIFTTKCLQNYLAEYILELDLKESEMFQSILKENEISMYNNCIHQLLVIANKIDLLRKEELDQLREIPELLCVSCKTQSNFQDFLLHLEKQLKQLCGTPLAEAPRLTQLRHRQQLEQCLRYIDDFLTNYSPSNYPDLSISAQRLRQAIKCIERITGHIITSEELLDIVFRDFCIGK